MLQTQQYLSIDVEGLAIHGLSVTEGTNDMSIIEQLSKIMHKICTQRYLHTIRYLTSDEALGTVVAKARVARART